MRSTKMAPLFLSNSYLTGSPPIGTSISTLMLCGGLGPTGIRSIFMMGAPLAMSAHEGHPSGKAPVAKAVAMRQTNAAFEHGGAHEQHDEEGGGGGSRHLLAGAWRLRQRGPRRGLSGSRDRPARCGACLRADGGHH